MRKPKRAKESPARGKDLGGKKGAGFEDEIKPLKRRYEAGKVL